MQKLSTGRRKINVLSDVALNWSLVVAMVMIPRQCLLSCAFLRVQTSETTKDSIEIKLPAAGLRLEGTAKQPTL